MIEVTRAGEVQSGSLTQRLTARDGELRWQRKKWKDDDK